MKKFLGAAALLLCGAVITGVLFCYTGLGRLASGSGEIALAAAGAGLPINETPKETTLLEDAQTVAALIRDRDYSALSQWVRPDGSVTFVPYSTVDPQKNQQFRAVDVKGFGGSEQKYVWGTVDGEGSPISLTPDEYFDRYVYDYDFVSAPVIGINTVVRSGNSLENVGDVYPDAEFVDLHYPGSEEYEGMDWKSLKLVFEKTESGRKLVAVIHSEWTV